VFDAKLVLPANEIAASIVNRPDQQGVGKKESSERGAAAGRGRLACLFVTLCR